MQQVRFSSGHGPGIDNVRRRESLLRAPGREDFYFEADLQAGEARITLAPQNQEVRFVLVGPVVPIVPLFHWMFPPPPAEPRFVIAARIDPGGAAATFDPGRTTLELPGRSTTPEGFYSSDCKGSGQHRHGAPLEPLQGPISLPAPACFSIAYPVLPPRPSTPFVLRVEGLVVAGSSMPLEIIFSPDTGWKLVVWTQ